MPKHLNSIAFLAALLLAAPFLRAAELPRKSPDFPITLGAGQQLRLSQYRGKVVVLLFFLTTCPHCQQTVAFLSKDQKEYGKRGLQVVACSIEKAAAQTVPGFIRKFEPPFPVGYNTDSDAVLAWLQHPPAVIPYVPMLAFIDRQGVIRAQYEGQDLFLTDETKQEQNLRARIEELLSAPSVKAAPRPAKKLRR